MKDYVSAVYTTPATKIYMQKDEWDISTMMARRRTGRGKVIFGILSDKARNEEKRVNLEMTSLGGIFPSLLNLGIIANE